MYVYGLSWTNAISTTDICIFIFILIDSSAFTRATKREHKKRGGKQRDKKEKRKKENSFEEGSRVKRE